MPTRDARRDRASAGGSRRSGRTREERPLAVVSARSRDDGRATLWRRSRRRRRPARRRVGNIHTGDFYLLTPSQYEYFTVFYYFLRVTPLKWYQKNVTIRTMHRIRDLHMPIQYNRIKQKRYGPTTAATTRTTTRGARRRRPRRRTRARTRAEYIDASTSRRRALCRRDRTTGRVLRARAPSARGRDVS